MFEFLYTALIHTIEYEKRGLNAATIGAVGTIAFTCIQLWALWDQFKNIKTGKSVSVTWHTYFTADFLAFLIYGSYAMSIAMTFNALLGFGHLLVLWGLLRVKQFSVRERLLLPIIVIFPVLMYFSRTYSIDFGEVNLWWTGTFQLKLTERELLFLLVSLGTIFALAQQPWEMYQNKSRGDVGYNLLASYTASTGFWICYAFFGANDPVLKFLTVSAGALLVLSMCLWYKYKPQPVVSASS